MMADLKVLKKEDNDFIVKVPGREDPIKIEDTFAEMFPPVATSPAKFPFF
jgi:hypothetical protein